MYGWDMFMNNDLTGNTSDTMHQVYVLRLFLPDCVCGMGVCQTSERNGFAGFARMAGHSAACAPAQIERKMRSEVTRSLHLCLKLAGSGKIRFSMLFFFGII